MPLSTSPSIEEIIDFYGEQTFIESWVFLYQEALTFISHFSKRLETKLNVKIVADDFFFVSEDIISEIVLDYYTDIYRLQKFHKIQKINSLKVSAYTTFWILRRKPIQVKSSIVDPLYEKSWAVHINESFSAMMYLGMAFNFSKKSSNKPQIVYRHFQDLLLYNFVYRPYSKESLELTLRALMVEFDCPMLTAQT